MDLAFGSIAEQLPADAAPGDLLLGSLAFAPAGKALKTAIAVRVGADVADRRQKQLETALSAEADALGEQFDDLVLDAADRPGGAWPHHWDSLRLFSPAEHSSLPGRPMPPSPGPGTPDAGHVVAYLADYEDRYGLPVRRGVRVTAVTHDAAASPPFTLRLEDGTALSARAVVSATGSFTRPFVPALPGADRFGGTQRHSAAYRSPDAFAGRRVLVVGGGNSGAQIAADLLLAGVATTWATRRPPRFMPDDVDGRVLFDRASARVLGRSEARVGDLGDIVMVPSVLDARERGVLVAQSPFVRLHETAVEWADGRQTRLDAVVWCTGFRPALDHLHLCGLVEADGKVGGLNIRNVVTGEESVLDATALFVAIGHDPRSAFLDGQVAVDEAGYVKVEEPSTRTSVPGVFACGDLVDKTYQQAITAAGSGCRAALDAQHYLAAL